MNFNRLFGLSRKTAATSLIVPNKRNCWQASISASFANNRSVCRGDPTRTGDHLVPNQVRYQLRYAPCFQHSSENGGKSKGFR